MMDKQNNNNISTHFAIPNNANPQEPVSAERPLRDYVKSPCKNTQLKVPQWHPRIQRLIIMSNIASITDQATHILQYLHVDECASCRLWMREWQTSVEKEIEHRLELYRHALGDHAWIDDAKYHSLLSPLYRSDGTPIYKDILLRRLYSLERPIQFRLYTDASMHGIDNAGIFDEHILTYNPAYTGPRSAFATSNVVMTSGSKCTIEVRAEWGLGWAGLLNINEPFMHEFFRPGSYPSVRVGIIRPAPYHMLDVIAPLGEGDEDFVLPFLPDTASKLYPGAWLRNNCVNYVGWSVNKSECNISLADGVVNRVHPLSINNMKSDQDTIMLELDLTDELNGNLFMVKYDNGTVVGRELMCSGLTGDYIFFAHILRRSRGLSVGISGKYNSAGTPLTRS